MSLASDGIDGLKQKVSDAEGELQRLMEENKRLQSRASELSDELLQVTAEREFYRFGGDRGQVTTGSPLPGSSGATGAVSQVDFTNAVKGYLSQIAAITAQHAESERSCRSLEKRLQRSESLHFRGNSKRSFSNSMYMGSIGDGTWFVDRDSIQSPDFEALEEDTRIGGTVDSVPQNCVMAEKKGGSRVQQGHARNSPSITGLDQAFGMHLTEEDVKSGAITAEDARAYYRMQQGVEDLSSAIEMREKAVQKLMENAKKLDLVKHSYERKMRQMDEETSRFEAERQKVRQISLYSTA